ncbi:hypothetical protein [Paraburkholderia heleia]|uniref:hypothetical protein n=1 Tax=Paraburkholderia heleia TaxID=634127 RepID=UPI002AB62FFD|nr:hypothetical protein [Paraburkholderia heleia]
MPTDLLDQPTIPPAQVNADWSASSGVAEILNKPAIPAAQVNADWSATSGVAQILNKPAQLAALPALTIEPGHSVQENGGLGIDQGSWYQYDFGVGSNTPVNGFEYTVNSDGTIVIESGVYLVTGSLKIDPTDGAPDTYDIPAQMTVAT